MEIADAEIDALMAAQETKKMQRTCVPQRKREVVAHHLEPRAMASTIALNSSFSANVIPQGQLRDET